MIVIGWTRFSYRIPRTMYTASSAVNNQDRSCAERLLVSQRRAREKPLDRAGRPELFLHLVNARGGIAHERLRSQVE